LRRSWLHPTASNPAPEQREHSGIATSRAQD
jgi:hypothetical protein